MSHDQRPFFSLRVDQLEDLFVKASASLDGRVVVEKIESELSYRSTKRALRLLRTIEEHQEDSANNLPTDERLSRIKESMDRKSFGGTLRAWRVYANRLGEQPSLRRDIIELWDFIYAIWSRKPSDYFVFSDDEMQFMEIDDSPLAGVLSHFGYRTKVKTKTRQTILNELFFGEIPPVVNHYQWGEPQTNERYDKIVSTLGGLAFPHRNQKSFEAAVKVWDTDRNWFVNEREGIR